MATLKIKNSFKKILEDNDAFDAYILSVRENMAFCNEESKEIQINRINNRETFEGFISSSFVWDKSPNGYTYWRLLVNKYKAD